MPKVSIIVPCYKYGQYVTDCVTSLLTNTEVDLDILVVDDASPDDSWSVVERLPRLDRRIRVLRNEQNKGLIGTANAGLEAAAGDYVVLLSSDDAHAPGWLDRAVALLELRPTAALAYGPTRRFTGSLPKLHRRRTVEATLHSGHDWIEQTCRRGVTAMLSPEVVVRTSVQHAVGGYRPELPYSSDMEMWLRMASVGDILQVNGPIAAFYRVSPHSMSRAIYLNLLSEIEVRRDAFDAWYRFADGRIADRERLMGIALNSLARRAVRRAYVAYLQDPEQFDGLCKAAVHNDPVWAAPQVERLTRLRDSERAARQRDRLAPVAKASIRARQAMTDVRAHLHII